MIFDSWHLPATTAATSAASTTTTAATAAETSTTTTEAATARSHAGGAAGAGAACVGSIESPGTTSEGIPVTCTTARKITTSYAIGPARANVAIRAASSSCAVTGACISPKAA